MLIGKRGKGEEGGSQVCTMSVIHCKSLPCKRGFFWVWVTAKIDAPSVKM